MLLSPLNDFRDDQGHKIKVRLSSFTRYTAACLFQEGLPGSGEVKSLCAFLPYA